MSSLLPTPCHARGCHPASEGCWPREDTGKHLAGDISGPYTGHVVPDFIPHSSFPISSCANLLLHALAPSPATSLLGAEAPCQLLSLYFTPLL